MFNFLKTPKGLIITGIILLVIVLLISYNWKTVKAWFSSAPASGRYAAPGSTAKKTCVSLGGDNCSYLGLYVPCIECSKRGISIN